MTRRKEGKVTGKEIKNMEKYKKRRHKGSDEKKRGSRSKS